MRISNFILLEYNQALELYEWNRTKDSSIEGIPELIN